MPSCGGFLSMNAFILLLSTQFLSKQNGRSEWTVRMVENSQNEKNDAATLFNLNRKRKDLTKAKFNRLSTRSKGLGRVDVIIRQRV